MKRALSFGSGITDLLISFFAGDTKMPTMATGQSTRTTAQLKAGKTPPHIHHWTRQLRRQEARLARKGRVI
ncbi:hypothetical protein BMI86_10240 [Thioclava sp. DLFJ5-1]|uniref:hypothetical protein n=1 Tax=Thioclava sp. DLFJ5-1 TaxID=1915314 RepID=UPI00099656D3|nr:hypothetical protein [Thioclava sp. DLFJ5-1]OOY20876.1 hypothetical protein BMI86_10240 [Thioclava sp. DLFJ5-1]